MIKIESIEISVFELPIYPRVTGVVEFGSSTDRRWKQFEKKRVADLVSPPLLHNVRFAVR